MQRAKVFGLPENDLANAQEMFEQNEFEGCFDVVATQLYEWDISIDLEFFELSNEITTILGIGHDQYSFLTKLIR